MCWWETRSYGEALSRASSSQLSLCWRYVRNRGFVRVWCHKVENLQLVSSWHSTIKDATFEPLFISWKKRDFFGGFERSDPIIELSWLYADSDMMCVSVSLGKCCLAFSLPECAKHYKFQMTGRDCTYNSPRSIWAARSFDFISKSDL